MPARNRIISGSFMSAAFFSFKTMESMSSVCGVFVSPVASMAACDDID